MDLELGIEEQVKTRDSETSDKPGNLSDDEEPRATSPNGEDLVKFIPTKSRICDRG